MPDPGTPNRVWKIAGTTKVVKRCSMKLCSFISDTLFNSLDPGLPGE